MKKILIFAGTRPEAIKMAPVIFALRSRPENFAVHVCASGQHREMLTQAFADFGISPDSNLEVMTTGQTLSGLSSRLFTAADKLLKREMPDVVLVQGDTTTVQVAALSAFYRGISVGHIEAGLRSHDMRQPFPEELNRRVTSLVASWHFAPTELARENLLKEGIREDAIIVTGNTVIDALLWMRTQVREKAPAFPAMVENAVAEKRSLILVTGHRRENFGHGIQQICSALAILADTYPEIRIVYPLHLNPNVRDVVRSNLNGHAGIILIDPLPYRPFVRLMDSCTLILTDSGGIQEEGPSMGKPVLVMRKVTERPEGVDAGVNFLVGTDANEIVANVSRFLSDSSACNRISAIQNPYGDGHAAEKIVLHLERI